MEATIDSIPCGITEKVMCHSRLLTLKPEHCFGPKVEKGYLLQDYENRSLKGENFEENIAKSTEKIKINWSNGGPNC